MATIVPPQPGLMRLPRELRDGIYNYLFAATLESEPVPEPLQIKKGKTIYHFSLIEYKLVINLLAVNKTLRAETIDYLGCLDHMSKRCFGIRRPIPSKLNRILSTIPYWLRASIVVVEQMLPTNHDCLDEASSCLPYLEKIMVSRRYRPYTRWCPADADDLEALLRGHYDDRITFRERVNGCSPVRFAPKFNFTGQRIEVAIAGYVSLRMLAVSTTLIPSVYILVFNEHTLKVDQRYVNIHDVSDDGLYWGGKRISRYQQDLVSACEVVVLRQDVDRLVLYHVPSGKFRMLLGTSQPHTFEPGDHWSQRRIEASRVLSKKVREQIENLREAGRLPTQVPMVRCLSD